MHIIVVGFSSLQATCILAYLNGHLGRSRQQATADTAKRHLACHIFHVMLASLLRSLGSSLVSLWWRSSLVSHTKQMSRPLSSSFVHSAATPPLLLHILHATPSLHTVGCSCRWIPVWPTIYVHIATPISFACNISPSRHTTRGTPTTMYNMCFTQLSQITKQLNICEKQAKQL